jgi:hypothetical protein
LEILREIIPTLTRLAYLANINNPTAKLSVDEVQVAAPKLGLEIIPGDIKRAEDIAPVLDALKGRAQALYVAGDPLVADNQIQINTLALAARLPTMHHTRGYADTGDSSPTDRTSRTCFAAPATTSTRFSRAQSLPTFPSNSRPRLNWSSISRPLRPLASKFLRSFCSLPTM